eukprot:353133-Amphidinium_carterae.1
MVMVAVAQHGHALQFASDSLRRNREIVLRAVQSHPCVLQCACEELRKDESQKGVGGYSRLSDSGSMSGIQKAQRESLQRRLARLLLWWNLCHLKYAATKTPC